MELKINDIVMCTVKRIEGTTVFLEIEGNGQGTIVMSEVAAGRIRNLREYVYPNKKIVCKILKINNGQIELSLRRVMGKEREGVEENYKKERTFINILKSILKNPELIIVKIKESYSLVDFFDKLKENPNLAKNFMEKSEFENLKKLLLEKKDKEKEVKKIIILKSSSESGIKDIKEVLSIKDVTIKYLGSSQFSISATAKDFREANVKIESTLASIESKAKEKKVFFSIKE